MGAGRRLLVIIACAAACLCGAAGLYAPSALAQTTFHPRIAGALGLVPPINSRGQMITADPATGAQIPATYHGGQVMSGGVVVHTIFWAPSGYSFQGSPGGGQDYIGLIQQFFTDVAQNSGAPGTCTSSQCSAFTVLWQFGQGTRPGAVTPGTDWVLYSAAADSINDTNPYPAKSQQCASPGGAATCITDAQLQAEVDRVVQSTPGTPRGLHNLWFVFLPPGVDACINAGDCGTSAFAGYHSVSNIAGHGVTIYALSIDPIIEGTIGQGADPEGYPDAEAAINIAAHETIEAMTDPEGAGWLDPNGGELGDKCVDSSQQVGTPLGFANGSPYNQVINGHPYLIQEMWANLDSGGSPGCVQSTSNDTVQLPLPQVNLTQFDPVLSGNVNRASGGGIGVRVTLLRADQSGTPVAVAAASTTTAADGSWSVSLAPHAPGDDRDEIAVDYSGASAPQPRVQLIMTGNGGNPFTELGWTGWFDMDHGSALSSSSLTLAPCFQSGLLSFSFNGSSGSSPTDFCNTQTDAATVGTPPAGPGDQVTATSNDNRAFDNPNAPAPNPLGGLVSLSVPVGEVGSISPFTNPLSPHFTAGGLASCTADLEFQAVLCDGLRPDANYSLATARHRTRAATDSTGTLVARLHLTGGDRLTLSNGARTLTVLHVAHLRVSIIGNEAQLAAGFCQPGDYYGAPPSEFPINTTAGVPTNEATGGVALTGQVCPTSGDATGLDAALISQTDDLSGGQTETEVPQIVDTSPMEGETMYGSFTALAESGLAAPGNMTFPTDSTTRITLHILTPGGRLVLNTKNVDRTHGLAVPALKPGPYVAVWVLSDANRDRRIVATRFIEQRGRLGRAPGARVTCRYTGGGHSRIGCRVAFPGGAQIQGTVRLRLSRGGTVIGLGHGRVRHGRADVSLKVMRQVGAGIWRLTLVLDQPRLIPVTETLTLGGVV